MTADPIPPSGCTICGSKHPRPPRRLRLPPASVLVRARASHSAIPTPGPVRGPRHVLLRVRPPTRGADLCSLCQPIALNAMTAIKENLA